MDPIDILKSYKRELAKSQKAFEKQGNVIAVKDNVLANLKNICIFAQK